jgi:tetratricopeptide (TPR) repeat protein
MKIKATTPSLRRNLPLAIAGACLGVVLLAGRVYAIGDDSSQMPTCPRGEIFSAKAKKCVKQEGSILPDKDRADYAYALTKAGRYEEAISVLDTLKNPNTAEALNYRGYATRKLGRTDEGISYYLESVALDPHYAKVREYLGEAYVIKGQMNLARDQLTTIKNLCGTKCEEYRDLSEAITHPSRM